MGGRSRARKRSVDFAAAVSACPTEQSEQETTTATGKSSSSEEGPQANEGEYCKCRRRAGVAVAPIQRAMSQQGRLDAMDSEDEHSTGSSPAGLAPIVPSYLQDTAQPDGASSSGRATPTRTRLSRSSPVQSGIRKFDVQRRSRSPLRMSRRQETAEALSAAITQLAADRTAQEEARDTAASAQADATLAITEAQRAVHEAAATRSTIRAALDEHLQQATQITQQSVAAGLQTVLATASQANVEQQQSIE